MPRLPRPDVQRGYAGMASCAGQGRSSCRTMPAPWESRPDSRANLTRSASPAGSPVTLALSGMKISLARRSWPFHRSRAGPPGGEATACPPRRSIVISLAVCKSADRRDRASARPEGHRDGHRRADCRIRRGLERRLRQPGRRPDRWLGIHVLPCPGRVWRSGLTGKLLFLAGGLGGGSAGELGDPC